MTKKRYTATIIVSSVLLVGSSLVGIYGYSVLLYYSWLIVLFAITVIALAVWKREPELTSYVRVLIALIVATVIGGFAGHGIRCVKALLVCRKCEPIIASLNAYKQTHGVFPTSSVPIIAESATGLDIGQGKFASFGYELEELNSKDMVVYLWTNGYACVVPVTKLLPMSFTRFYVYERGATNDHWIYDKVVWTLGLREGK